MYSVCSERAVIYDTWAVLWNCILAHYYVRQITNHWIDFEHCVTEPLCVPLVQQNRHSGCRFWSQWTECSCIWQRTVCTASLTSAQLVLSNTVQAERIVTTINCAAVCPHESRLAPIQPSTKLVLGVKRPAREPGHLPSSSVKVKN